MPSSIVHQMCRCVLYVVTVLSFKRPCIQHIRFHSLPSVSVIPVCPASWSPKSHHWHWRPAGNWKGLSTLCGQCPHGLRARTPHAYTCQWPPSYSWCSSCWLSVAPLPRPWSARQQTHRFEQIVAALVTDCVHTTGDCTHVPCWWCSSKYPWGAWAASTPQHNINENFLVTLAVIWDGTAQTRVAPLDNALMVVRNSPFDTGLRAAGLGATLPPPGGFCGVTASWPVDMAMRDETTATSGKAQGKETGGTEDDRWTLRF